MNILILSSAFITGGLLALLYFSGLWWTVKRIPGSGRPGLLMLASLIVRLGVVLAGFYLVMSIDTAAVLACLAGFFITRLVFVRRIEKRRSPVEEVA